MAPLLLKLDHVSKIYGREHAEVWALNDVSLSVEQGQFVALMGASGSGKSTCMNILGALDSPTNGRYLFQGIDLTSLSQYQLSLFRRHYVGFVFQEYNLLARTTAIENVELALVYRGIARKERRDRARQALVTVGLADREDHSPAEMSGGQRQRVAIARALACEPTLLLADEPTGNLDSTRKLEIMDLLGQLNSQRGITIVMVTHEPDMAHYFHRTVHFRDGKIEHEQRRPA